MEVIILKTTGIVRRIDELGRIVIPKEVRKRLRMDSGDLVDIFVNEDKVVLSKFNPLDHDGQIVSLFCSSIKESYGCDYIITNTHKILYNTIDNELNARELDKEFTRRIYSYLDKEISPLNKVCITEGFCLNKDAIINQVIVDHELFGYLIILDDIIGKKQKDLAQLILNFLNKVL